MHPRRIWKIITHFCHQGFEQIGFQFYTRCSLEPLFLVLVPYTTRFFLNILVIFLIVTVLTPDALAILSCVTFSSFKVPDRNNAVAARDIGFLPSVSPFCFAVAIISNASLFAFSLRSTDVPIFDTSSAGFSEPTRTSSAFTNTL